MKAVLILLQKVGRTKATEGLETEFALAERNGNDVLFLISFSELPIFGMADETFE